MHLLSSQRLLSKKLAIIPMHVNVLRVESATLFDQLVKQVVAMHDTRGIGRELDACAELTENDQCQCW